MNFCVSRLNLFLQSTLKRVGLIAFLVNVPALASIQSIKAEAEWIMTQEKEGIKVYKKEIPGSDIMAFKGEGIVEANIQKVATVLFDTDRAPEWVVDLVSAKIVRWEDPHQFIEYDHFQTPPLIKDRDFVSRVNFTVNPQDHSMTFVYRSAVTPDLPPTGKVRGELMNSTFILVPIEGGTKTKLIGEIHCDPKGSIPKWLVNFFQKDWPVDTILNLRKQLKKADIKLDPRFAQSPSS